MADIREFRHVVETATGLRAWPTATSPGFMMGGRFRIILRLDPHCHCAWYEYRQFIRGTCTGQRGHFTGPPSLANWHADGAELDRSSVFHIPGGLNATTLQEDGIVEGGHISRFGYRSATATQAAGVEDRYLPDQANGCEYHATDTYGLKDATRVAGTRIRLHLWFEGRVIDTQNHDQVVRRLNWEVSGDDIVTA